MMRRAETSFKRSVLLIALGKYSNVVFAFIANIILARFLSPEEYGVVAVVTVFSTFFSLFTDMGFGAGVIQNKELTQADIDHIFSYTVYVGIVCALLFCGLSYGIADIYGNAAYIRIGHLLSLSLAFNSWNMIPNAVLMREKRFKDVAIRTVILSFLTYAITIALAAFGFSYYALVIQSVVSSIATFVWNWWSTKIKYIPLPRYSSVKKIISFSMYGFVYDVVNFFSRNLDSLLAGRFIGESALGYYNKAYTLMLYPTHYLTGVITPVLHPVFSDYQNEPKKIYDHYMKVNRFLMLIGVYMSVFSHFASKEMIIVLFGEKWADAIPCMRILSLTIWIQMSVASCTSVFFSLGRTDLRLVSGFIYAPIQIAMITIGALSGDIVIMAQYVAISYVVRFFIEYYFLIKKAFGMRFRRFLEDIKGLIFTLVLTFSISMMVTHFTIENNVFSAIMKLCICTSAFLISAGLLKQLDCVLIVLPNRMIERIRGKISK